MSQKLSHLVFWLLIILALTGCAVPASPPAAQPDVATIVAATLQALPAAETPVPAEEMPDAGAAAPYPAFSGLRVAYIKQGNLMVWTEGGNPLTLTATQDAQRLKISPDGQYIAYVRQPAEMVWELWVVNVDAAPTPRLLVSRDEMAALQAASPYPDAGGFDFDQIAWRPGTHELYYSTVPRFMGPGYAPGYDLRVINVDSGAKTTLLEFGQAGRFTFSPDGAQLALATPDQIDLINADGSQRRAAILTYPRVMTYSEYWYAPTPIWAADSASLRVAIPPEDPLASPAAPTTFWRLPVDGSPAVQLGSIPAVPFAWPDNAFSPDLNDVAYVAAVGDPAENQCELHLAAPDGSNDRLFASGQNLRFEGWLPDSARFVYADETGLYLGDLLGSVSVISSAPQTIRQPAWLDDGRMIFVYDHNGSFELRISDLNGSRHAFIDTLTEAYAAFDFAP